MPLRRLSAGWLLSMDAPPIAGGAVLIGADGRVLEAGPDAVVSRPAQAESHHWTDAAILPGLVNTHTHLELTGFAGLAEEADFPSWIRRIRGLKGERKAEQFLEAARAGLAACHRAGVTTIADTGDSGAVIQALAEAGGSGIAYHEVFGPHPDQLQESLAGLHRRLAELRPFVSARVRLGLSPHAPYTVSAPLYAAAARLAEREGLPVAVHLAESEAESELVHEASGPFAEAWTARGIPLPELPGRSPVALLDELGVLTERTLAIHVVQAGPADVTRLARSGAAVAHCPLSNRRHAHGMAPLAAFLEAGLRVGVGTDSEASVGALDLLAEARAARALAGLGALDTLRLVTSGAARAIGLEGEVGALRPGAWGDVAVVTIGASGTPEGALEAALASGPADVRETVLGGRTVHRR